RLLAGATATLSSMTDVLADLGRRFDVEGYELYLVGGSVRDAVLGRLGADLDFTTDARPEAVQGILQDCTSAQWDTGIAFGTISAVRGDLQIEVTTYRA